MTIAPRRRTIMPRSTARQQRKSAAQVDVEHRVPVVVAVSARSDSRRTPALLTRPSSGPRAASTSATRSSGPAAVARSSWKARARPPVAASTCRAAAPVRAPGEGDRGRRRAADASASTTARPMPRLPPVTRTGRPSQRLQASVRHRRRRCAGCRPAGGSGWWSGRRRSRGAPAPSRPGSRARAARTTTALSASKRASGKPTASIRRPE